LDCGGGGNCLYLTVLKGLNLLKENLELNSVNNFKKELLDLYIKSFENDDPILRDIKLSENYFYNDSYIRQMLSTNNEFGDDVVISLIQFFLKINFIIVRKNTEQKASVFAHFRDI
jgi:hypothetical protein